jgi:hypothetical protein
MYKVEAEVKALATRSPRGMMATRVVTAVEVRLAVVVHAAEEASVSHPRTHRVGDPDPGPRPSIQPLERRTQRQPMVGPCSCPTSPATCSTLPVGSARSSAAVPEEVPFGVGRRHGGRTVVSGCRLAMAAQPSKQIGSGGVEGVVVVQL